MRKYMTKEVTSTTIQLGSIVIENGVPTVKTMEPLVVLGTISQEKAQKRVTKDYPIGTAIISMTEKTDTYKMKVTDFIKVAELVQDENDATLEEEEEDEE